MDKQLKLEIAAMHAQICGALSNPTRLLMICTLADGGKTVGEISAELEIPQSSTSRNLKILEEKGLVYATRQGPVHGVSTDR